MGSPRRMLMLVAALALAVTSAAAQGQAKKDEGTVKKILDKGAEVKAAGAKRAAAAEAVQQQKDRPEAAAPQANQPARGSAAGAKTAGAGERRDPFVTPLSKVSAQKQQATCVGPGKRSLVLGQTTLRGVTRTPGGMIAMVVASGDRAFFLRENDQVCNGRVVKITEDSLVYEETVLDALGRVQKKQQAQKLPAEK